MSRLFKNCAAAFCIAVLSTILSACGGGGGGGNNISVIPPGSGDDRASSPNCGEGTRLNAARDACDCLANHRRVSPLVCEPEPQTSPPSPSPTPPPAAVQDVVYLTGTAGAQSTITLTARIGQNPVPPRNARFAFAVLPPPNPIVAPRESFRTGDFNFDDGLLEIGADAAYARGYWGQGVTVAVIDGGMRTTHIDLRDKVLPGYNFVNSIPVVNDAPNPENAPGHGTAVAGIIAASRNAMLGHGVAPSVALIPLQIGDKDTGAFTGNERSAFLFALSSGVHIINNSYGLVPNTVRGTYEGLTYYVEIPDFAPFFPRGRELANSFAGIIDDRDVVAVWAAGNDRWQTGDLRQLCEDSNGFDRDTPCDILRARTATIPQLLENFIVAGGQQGIPSGRSGRLGTIHVTVAGVSLGVPASGTEGYSLLPLWNERLLDRWLTAVSAEDNFDIENPRLADHSNGCGDASFWCITAPGENIRALGHLADDAVPMRERDGTSFAAPHVSGALALLKSRLPSMPMSAVRALLLVSADDVGDEGVDADFGWGFVNLERAVTMQSTVRLPAPDSSSGGNDNGAAPGHSPADRTLSLNLPPPNAATAAVNVFHTGEFNRNYGLRSIGAEYAYSRGYFGQDVTVAVLDTGMRTTHIDLRDNIVPGGRFDSSGRAGGSVTDPISSFNDIGHGTAVGGVIAARRNSIGAHGVAPQAKLMPLQFADNFGSLNGSVEAAIRFAVANGAKIINNSWGVSTDLVGTYQGTRYHANIPSLAAFSIARDAAIANEVRGQDVVLVWSAGNARWNGVNGRIRLCRDVDAGLNRLERCSLSDEIRVTPKQLVDGFVSEGYTTTIAYTITAYSAGHVATATAVRSFIEKLPAHGALSALNLPTVGAGVYPRLPIMDGDLLPRWLAVAATDNNDVIAHWSNGCGDAMFWCISAPGASIYTTDGRGDNSNGRYDGTSFAAPHVSGALAVLKSRLPSMPMYAVRAILLHAAKDLGAAGVDENYGWGLVDLKKAITLQGATRVVLDDKTRSSSATDGGGGVLVRDARILLPPGFAAARERLNGISIAAAAFGDAHYNMALGDLAVLASAVPATLGDAAGDMLRPADDDRFSAGAIFAASDGRQLRHAGADADLRRLGEWRFQHNFCEGCKTSAWEDWGSFADDAASAPFFAPHRAAFVLQMRGDGPRPFAAFSGKAGDADEHPYKQFGVRWARESGAFSFAAEASEIRESDSFFGASFGALGRTKTKTRQGKLTIRGALGGEWRGFASYERAHGRADAGGGGILRGASGLRAHGWKAGLQRDNILIGGDRFRISAGRKTTMRRGHADLQYARAACADGGAGDCFNEAAFGDVRGAPEIFRARRQTLLIERARVKLSSPSALSLSAGYSFPLSLRGAAAFAFEHDAASGENALSARLQIEF